MMRLTITMAGAALTALMLTAPAQAAPGAGLGEAATAVPPSQLTLVHGCHRNVELGPAGWHYHVGRNCRRMAAAAPRSYRRPPPPRYRQSCRQVCKYVGPIKVCETRCN